MKLSKFTSSLIFILFLFCFPAATFGMDFFWESKPYNQVVLSGEIKAGDSEKLRSFIRQNFEKYKAYRRIRLASNGGNLVEALKIAAILRSIYPNIDIHGEKCASSCFFLYLSGVTRSTDDSSLLGIHRAFFEPAYFAKLKPEEAKIQQVALKKLLDSILDENQVPQYLKERMNGTSSADIYWLSDDDIQKIGYMPAWYEELLIAKCNYGTYLSLIKKALDAPENDPKLPSYPDLVAKSLWDSSECEEKMIKEQLSKIPSTLIGETSSKKSGIR